MTDPRTTPANGRVAATRLRGTVTAARFTDGARASVSVAVADLLRRPDGPRDRQLLFGAPVTVYERHDGWAYLEDEAGYVGYVRDGALGPAAHPSHAVRTRATHAYARPDFKSAERTLLPLGARVTVSGPTEGTGRFAATSAGFVPVGHLRPVHQPETDPVAVAATLLGTPYLWGGNSSLGIDCSGLVQLALQQCAKPCPGDSDQQAATLGTTLAQGTPPRRGDLLFWSGHVAWVADPDTLLHANAHDMAVTFEPLVPARDRILRQGDGDVTRHARL